MAPWRFSATIVTYRPEARLLEAAVRSLDGAIAHARAHGVISEATLFLVDNSPERERGLVAQAAALFTSAVEILSGHGNIGYGRANNLALGKLRSDVHLVMNPDVELEPSALTEGLAAMAADPSIGVVAPAVKERDAGIEHLCKRYPSVWVLFLRGLAPESFRQHFRAALDTYEMRDLPRDHPSRVPLASGCFMLIRTPLFVRLGGFDPRFFLYFEDYDLSVRAARESAVTYVPRARIVHHGGGASAKGLRHVAWFVRSAWRFFSTHGWKLA